MEHTTVTYKKIANALNVSQSTVSKALSGSREVSAELSEKIFIAAKEMGYFAQKRERNREYAKNFCPKIAILVPEIISIHYSDLATRFADEIEKNGGKASLYITGFDRGTVADLLAEIYDEVHFDGVILLTACKYEGEIKLPTMALGFTPVGSHFDYINSNIESGMREALKHLTELGHKEIGFAGEPLTIGKEKAFRHMLAEAGLKANDEHIFCISDRFENIGTETGKRIAKMSERPTAIVTAYDEVAIGLISSLAEKGIKVPEDISVVGMNDIPVAKYLNPPLTTIVPHTTEKCTIAVDLLMRKIKRHEAVKFDSHMELSTTLVVRGSTGRAKKHL